MLWEMPEMQLGPHVISYSAAISDLHTLVRVASLLCRSKVWDNAVDDTLHEAVYQLALSRLNHILGWVVR